jgi:putative membrane protein
MTYQSPPPPPPTGMADSRLSSIKTYILIALIFSIISTIAWLAVGITYILGYLAAAATLASLGAYGYDVGAGFAIVGLITGIIFLVLMVISIMVFLRVWKMYKAVNAGDIATLKAKSSMMWAIIALIFAGVIPGIMLIISDGPIKQL